MGLLGVGGGALRFIEVGANHGGSIDAGERIAVGREDRGSLGFALGIEGNNGRSGTDSSGQSDFRDVLLALLQNFILQIASLRHELFALFGLPAGRVPDFPIVIDELNQVYFRPEGREMMLVGLEIGNEVGGSPDRPLTGL